MCVMNYKQQKTRSKYMYNTTLRAFMTILRMKPHLLPQGIVRNHNERQGNVPLRVSPSLQTCTTSGLLPLTMDLAPHINIKCMLFLVDSRQEGCVTDSCT